MPQNNPELYDDPIPKDLLLSVGRLDVDPSVDEPIPKDLLLSVGRLDGAGGNEPIPTEMLEPDLMSLSPEGLFNKIRANPGGDYTDSELDKYLDFKSRKPFSISETAGMIAPAAIHSVGTIAGGLLDLAKLMNPKTDRAEGEVDKLKASASIAEGSLRGTMDLYLLGKSIGFANSLTDTVAEADPGASQLSTSRIPTVRRRKLYYSDFPEERKAEIRDKFRKLGFVLGRRGSYEQGEATAIGDVAESMLEPEEGEAVAQMLGALVAPKLAEAASMVAGPEGPAVKVAGTVGKAAQNAAARAITPQVAKGARGVSKVSGKVHDALEFADNAPVVNIPGRTIQGLEIAFDQASDYLNGVSRQIGRETGENVFLRMSRDAALPAPKRKMAYMLGHGLANRFPFLSPGLTAVGTGLSVAVQGVASGARGGGVGGLMALPTWDEEMVAGSIGGASALAFAGTTGRGALSWGDPGRVKAAANNWLSTLQPEQRQIIRKRGFSDDQIARWSTWENFVRGVAQGSTGDTNVDFIYTDGKSFNQARDIVREKGIDQAVPLEDIQSDFQKIVDNAGTDQILSPTRGVQILNNRRPDAKPVVVVNLDKMSPTTVIHEAVHAMKNLDVFQGYLQNVHGILFDQPARVTGEEGTKGIVSDADLDKLYDSYLDRVRQSEGEPAAKAIEEEVETLAANYALRNENAIEANPSYWRRSLMKDEVEADMFESLMANRRPLYITKPALDETLPYMRGPLGRMANVIGQFLTRTAPPESLSVQGYKPRGKRINYENPELVAEVNSLINFGNRLEIEGKGESAAVVKPEAVGRERGEGYRAKQIKKGTRLAKQLEGSVLVKEDENGRPMFDANDNLILEDSVKALRKKERVRAQKIREIFSNNDYAAEEGVPGNPVNFDLETDKITGDYLSDRALATLKSELPEKLGETLEHINEGLKTGDVLALDYNARLKPKGRNASVYSSSIGSSLRYVVPFSFYTTKAGNAIINTVDLGHLTDKLARVMNDRGPTGRRKRITRLWDQGDDTATARSFNESLVQYIENTLNPGPEGLARGLDLDPKVAREKANVLSAFMGFNKKNIDFRNNRERQQAILDHMSPRTSRDDNIIRSRRIDAINSVTTTDLPRMPLTQRGFKDIQENLEPNSADLTGK